MSDGLSRSVWFAITVTPQSEPRYEPMAEYHERRRGGESMHCNREFS